MSKEIKEILRPYRCFIKQEAETVAAIKALIESKCNEACDKVKANYPYDLFPKDGKSQDCKSAEVARITCDNIKRELLNAPSPTDKKQ